MRWRMQFFAVAVVVVTGSVLSRDADAQPRTPAYVVVEVQVSDDAAYMKEFAPLVRPLIEAQGGQYLARGGKSEVVEGPPPSKLTLIKFEDLEHATAAFRSPAYRELRKVGDRYATFRIVVVEGLAVP